MLNHIKSFLLQQNLVKRKLIILIYQSVYFHEIACVYTLCKQTHLKSFLSQKVYKKQNKAESWKGFQPEAAAHKAGYLLI